MKALVSAAAGLLLLVVTPTSTTRAQGCGGALIITVPSPKTSPPTGPFLAVGDSTTVKINLGSELITGGTQFLVHRVRYELDCNHLFALGLPCTDQGDIMSYDFTQTVGPSCVGGVNAGQPCGEQTGCPGGHCPSGGALVQCQGRTWTATAGGSANEVVFTPDTPIVLPPEQSASPTLNNCFISFQVKLESLEPTSGPNSDDTPQQVEVVAGLSTVIGTDGHADAECDNGDAVGISQSSGVVTCPACAACSACNTVTGKCDATPCSTSTTTSTTPTFSTSTTVTEPPTTTTSSTTSSTTIPSGCVLGGLPEDSLAGVECAIDGLRTTLNEPPQPACRGSGPCKHCSLEPTLDRVASLVMAAANTTSAKKCKRSLRMARLAAKSLSARVASLSRGKCLAPADRVTRLDAEAVDLANRTKALLKSHFCAGN